MDQKPFHLLTYFREAALELRKVTWPTRTETIRASTVVLVGSLAIAAFFALVDWGLSLGLEKLLQLTSA